MFVNVMTAPNQPQDKRMDQFKACSMPLMRVCGYPGLFAELSVMPDDRHFDLTGAVMHTFLAWMLRSQGREKLTLMREDMVHHTSGP